MTSEAPQPSKSGIGTALLRLSQNPALKTSPAHSSRAPSALRSPNLAPETAINPLDTSDHLVTNPVGAAPPKSPSDLDQSVAQSINLLSGKLAQLTGAQPPRSAIKPRAPDAFDGMDPHKLDNFVFQCSMYFAVRSADFPDDESRVTFALSYLTDTPLDWFRTEFNDSLSLSALPPWFSSYPLFTAELRRLFGPSDPVTSAMDFLEGLRYEDTTKAARYTLDFNNFARRTGWNDRALLHQFYKNLPDRLKDEIARVGKPNNLRALQELVNVLDQRYWERQSEIERTVSSDPPRKALLERLSSPAPSSDTSDASAPPSPVASDTAHSCECPHSPHDVQSDDDCPYVSDTASNHGENSEDTSADERTTSSALPSPARSRSVFPERTPSV